MNSNLFVQKNIEKERFNNSQERDCAWEIARCYLKRFLIQKAWKVFRPLLPTTRRVRTSLFFRGVECRIILAEKYFRCRSKNLVLRNLFCCWRCKKLCQALMLSKLNSSSTSKTFLFEPDTFLSQLKFQCQLVFKKSPIQFWTTHQMKSITPSFIRPFCWRSQQIVSPNFFLSVDVKISLNYTIQQEDTMHGDMNLLAL